MNLRSYRLLAYFLSFALTSLFARCIKLSWLVGSTRSAFSLTHCFMPLFGIFGSATACLALAGLRSATTILSGSPLHLIIASCHIPSLCGSLYFSLLGITINSTHTKNSYQRYVFMLIPLLCIITFLLHPANTGAFWYSAFWLIPLATAYIPHSSFFLHALGSTFTTHAVGTILWIMINPAPRWEILAPLVCIERLVFALGMTACYYTARYMQKVFAIYSLQTITRKNPAC